MKDTKKKQ